MRKPKGITLVELVAASVISIILIGVSIATIAIIFNVFQAGTEELWADSEWGSANAYIYKHIRGSAYSRIQDNGDTLVLFDMNSAESGVFFNIAAGLVYSEDPSLFTTVGRSGFDYQAFLQGGGDAELFSGTEVNFSDAEGNITLNTDLTEIRVAYIAPFANVAYVSSRLKISNTWAKTFAGNDYCQVNSLQKTFNAEGEPDGYIMSGTSSILDPDGEGGTTYVHVIKTDLSGTRQWSKIFLERGIGSSMFAEQTTDGGYIVVCSGKAYHNPSEPSIWDACIIKVSASGTALWAKAFGGGYPDAGNFVRQTSDDGYIIGGRTLSFSARGMYGQADMYLIRTDPNGNHLWSRNFKEANCNEMASTVQQTSDGGYIVAGYQDLRYVHPTRYLDVYIIKVDDEGREEWSRTFDRGDGFHRADDTTAFIQQTADGGYIILSHSKMYGDYDPTNPSGTCFWLIKTDERGHITDPVTGAAVGWTKVYGTPGADNASFVQPTSDGGYILAGNSNKSPTAPNKNYDAYLVKVDANGNEQWSNFYGGDGDDGAGAVQETADGGYVVAGFTTATDGKTRYVYLFKTDAEGNCPESSDPEHEPTAPVLDLTVPIHDPGEPN